MSSQSTIERSRSVITDSSLFAFESIAFTEASGVSAANWLASRFNEADDDDRVGAGRLDERSVVERRVAGTATERAFDDAREAAGRVTEAGRLGGFADDGRVVDRTDDEARAVDGRDRGAVFEVEAI